MLTLSFLIFSCRCLSLCRPLFLGFWFFCLACASHNVCVFFLNFFLLVVRFASVLIPYAFEPLIKASDYSGV